MNEEQAEAEEAPEEEEDQEEAEQSEEEIEEAPEEAKETKVEEEEKPAAKEEKEEEIVEERIYTVPLGRAWLVPRKKHSPKAMRLLRSFITRHMKANEDSIRITNEVNERVWSKGIQKPPRKIRIRATKDTEGIVTIHLAEGD